MWAACSRLVGLGETVILELYLKKRVSGNHLKASEKFSKVGNLSFQAFSLVTYNFLQLKVLEESKNVFPGSPSNTSHAGILILLDHLAQ